MMKNNFVAIDFVDGRLVYINQVLLPLVEKYIETDSYERISESIERLEIRGAPAIGVASAYALALSIKNVAKNNNEIFEKAFKRISSTRPTAVNLFWAITEIKKIFDESKEEAGVYKKLLKRAKEIHNDDINKCERIGNNGLKIFQKKSVVLTHCNTGKLATAGEGTALNVIKKGFRNNLVDFVYVDETRPLMQGSRLTAYELEKEGIPFSLITDSTASFLMNKKKIDLAIVGADRIARNGDTANKVGTYNVAVNCSFHKLPFYVAAPITTIDSNCIDGDNIIIEQRNKKEITAFGEKLITKEYYSVYAPAFDVTPSELITGIITDEAVHSFPYNF
jgi:methylthioribose-1-phosphate isomerase